MTLLALIAGPATDAIWLSQVGKVMMCFVLLVGFLIGRGLAMWIAKHLFWGGEWVWVG